MSITKINLDVFEESHRSGLLFSMYEGLKPGEAFRVYSKQGLEDIRNKISSFEVENLQFILNPTSEGVYEAEVKKVDESKVGCCGMCGG